MGNKYVVKDFEAQTYYAGEWGGEQRWEKEAYQAEYFDSIEDAERFIDRENGNFKIELFVNKSRVVDRVTGEVVEWWVGGVG